MDIELGLSYSQLAVGMKASLSKTVSESDVYLFAGVTGDFNPMHVNEEYAKTTRFGARIAHGSLVEGFMAPVLGTKLPGLGTIALEKQARFVGPTYFGDTITATAEVSEKLADKKWVRLKCTWTNQRGETVAFGQALVMPPPER
ncbi:MAG: MaoC family dehydratase [Desulfarculus sp.]|jgi:acyl dehydratase|nr:MAG: MaoC family dehydratase [Desulfarculus sp.]